jgi:hypothetical protein
MVLRSTAVLIAYVLLSVLVGTYQAILYKFGFEPGISLQVTWACVALLLVIFWVELDCREHQEIFRPFDFGFLLFLFWPFYLPYYLFRTRGAYAVLWLLGFVGLGFVGYALEWAVYLAH